ncbi:MAG: hypothetical protein A2V78_05270 [Betaproteobacteria bacterium RBG_16_64_18]|nr:MAG: hypothetical protein A2V78_05270 [Betaproteobacteria bacterium RBG_16_64_18]OGA11365.1 MAG: hypothetical protein A3H33_10825 [Betaproteobacteria bacterium RIFCSPLOWO2_02_FULL_65_20]
MGLLGRTRNLPAIIAKFKISYDGKLIKLLLSMQPRTPMPEPAKPESIVLRRFRLLSISRFWEVAKQPPKIGRSM